MRKKTDRIGLLFLLCYQAILGLGQPIPNEGNPLRKPTLGLICVGVNTYQDSVHNWDCRPGDSANSDLIESYFAQLDSWRLTASTHLKNEEAKQADVRKVFQSFQNLDSLDQIVVYFSGHALLDPAGYYRFCAFDSDFDELTNTAISGKEILASCEKLPAKQITLILETCYSGLVDGRKPKNKSPQKLQNASSRTLPLATESSIFSHPNITILASNFQGQKSYYLECRGLFTETLLTLFQREKMNLREPDWFDLQGFPKVVRIVRGKAKGNQEPQILWKSSQPISLW